MRTFALLEMAKYIAIQDHHNPLSQHGIASYVTKFESKSIRLRSNFGAAFAQRESCCDFSHCFHNTELNYRSDEITYTDGSRKEIRLVTGSGVYRENKHAHAQHHQQGRPDSAFDRSETLQTGNEREHSNRLEVLEAEGWHAPNVTVSRAQSAVSVCVKGQGEAKLWHFFLSR